MKTPILSASFVLIALTAGCGGGGGSTTASGSGSAKPAASASPKASAAAKATATATATATAAETATATESASASASASGSAEAVVDADCQKYVDQMVKLTMEAGEKLSDEDVKEGLDECQRALEKDADDTKACIACVMKATKDDLGACIENPACEKMEAAGKKK